jgi:hypothetical protein
MTGLAVGWIDSNKMKALAKSESMAKTAAVNSLISMVPDFELE